MIHTLSVLVEDKPGALMRISSMFARRGYNIESLAVGPTERQNVSRIVLRVDCEQHSLEQIEKQMHKLVNVLRVSELESGQAVERELALITVSAAPAQRAELLSLADVLGVRVADVGPNAIVFEVVGAPEQIDTFEELVRPHGIKELARTGRIGLARASVGRSAPSNSSTTSERKPTVATIYNGGNVDLLSGKVAILGFGSQGHAHALNLHESGVDVMVGLRPGSASRDAAEAAGLTVGTVAEAVKGAQVVAFLLPDQVQKRVYEEDVAANLADDAALVFAHGFNVHYGRIQAPPGHDVLMVAPKGPGHVVRRLFTEGLGTPAVVAVAQDASGQALELALAYGTALGAGRAGMIETTFAEETETDLFGEQAVLCGGTAELIRAGFETLVEAGYQPEVAYYECLHELKLIVDLIWEGGLSHMRWSISDTAEYGDFTRGNRVIDDHVRAKMREVLGEIQDGTFAREWIAEMDSGEHNLDELRAAARERQIEQVGLELRSLMTRKQPAGEPSVG